MDICVGLIHKNLIYIYINMSNIYIYIYNAYVCIVYECVDI